MDNKNKREMTTRPAPYRQLPPAAGSELTLKSLKNDFEEHKRRRRLCDVVVVLLWLGGLIGFIVWLAILTSNENGQQTTINGIQSNVTSVENNRDSAANWDADLVTSVKHWKRVRLH